MSETELEHFWWEKTQDGLFEVNPMNLVFSITLHELCVVEILHMESKEEHRYTQDELIKIWKAEVLNLRKLDTMTVVRAFYYQFFNPKGSNRKDFPSRWKASWDSAKYYLEVDLDEAWLHLTDPEAYSQKVREEARKAFGIDPNKG